MKSYRKYSTNENEKKVFTVVVFLILLALVTLAVLTICGVFDQQIWKPDVSYPMANAKVTWLQTYHPGAWAQ